MRMLNFRGQTLIEVIIAIAVGTLIITAILGLATRSTRNANFSRANEQASKLSQQGLEVIRNIRDDENNTTFIGILPTNNWAASYSRNFVDTSPSGEEFRLLEPGDDTCPAAGATWCLEKSTLGEKIDNDNQNFFRSVFIADDPQDAGSGGVSQCHTTSASSNPNNFLRSDMKQVTVVVSWDDPSGSHEAKVSSCIAPKT